MTKTNYFSHKLLASAVALAMVTFAASAENIPQFATVVRITGQARYSVDNNKTWTSLKRGDVLQAGSVIQTAEKSTVDVVMGESQGDVYSGSSGASPISTSGAGGSGADNGPKSNVVRIQESTVLAVDKLTLEKTGMDEVSETQLDLRAGQIMGNVKKLSAASRYEVKLPNGVAGIRGTSYILKSDGTVWVLTGQVIITYVSPSGAIMTQTVSGGQSFSPNGGLGTIPPDELTRLLGNLPAPTPAYQAPGNPNKNGTLLHISPD